MKLRYTFSDIGKGNKLTTKSEAIKSTDEAAKAMGDIIRIISELVAGKTWVARVTAWILSHAYTRKLTSDYVEYNFYLIGWLYSLSLKDKGQNEK